MGSMSAQTLQLALIYSVLTDVFVSAVLTFLISIKTTRPELTIGKYCVVIGAASAVARLDHTPLQPPKIWRRRNLVRLCLASVCAAFLCSCTHTDASIDKGARGAFPAHGNWCGPSHPKAGTDPVVVDDIDQACKSHDECYGKYGYFTEGCDHTLLRELDTIVRHKGRDLTREQRLAIAEIRSAFGLITPGTIAITPLEFVKVGTRSVLHNAKCFSLIPFFWFGQFKAVEAECSSSPRTW
jgi:hypothetical protein